MPYNARQPHRPGRSHARSPRLPVRSRRWCLDRRSLLLALLLFGLLVLLATLGRHWGWIRSFGGDLLAVVWLYYLMGSALRAPAAWLASAAFAVGALLELGQYLAAQLHWQFSSPVLRIVLGSTADGFDLLAYALGALLAWWLERRR
ncbi:DUF2809 domain-containing protein [Pseudomonas aeruginosa]|nr:DUF2809 domain-containing protein [Pseudomonas aeruginosa]MDF5879027.1 DUF2809 domain-containing protein [Pseudomonas aeruginosa]MDF5881002.1 DUF2809 domain-containing protein [Pseudomonas aeruginosa]MDF5989420.1 DUF2809 domain-containing protein [Pseudomonas aeruginosa]SPY60920.1 Protein of uncharacterised function (DUF2809) [Pseudomonas aeruginosa]